MPRKTKKKYPFLFFGQGFKTTRDMSYLAVNLLQDVIDSEPKKPQVWAAWLEKLATEGDRDLRDTFREMADDLRG